MDERMKALLPQKSICLDCVCAVGFASDKVVAVYCPFFKRTIYEQRKEGKESHVEPTIIEDIGTVMYCTNFAEWEVNH